MELTPRTRLRLRARNAMTLTLYLLALALLGWLSTRYSWQWDWTQSRRHTLSAASQKLLTTLQGPVRVTAFVGDNDLLRDRIRDLVARYQRYKDNIELRFENPETDPERVRALGIGREGTLYLEHGQGHRQLVELDEQALTNALMQLARGSERWVVFLSGHGERQPLGEANHDLGRFGEELQRKGFSLQELNLAITPNLPDNTSVLVIAGPQVNVLPAERDLIRRYVANGGNLLWLADTDGIGGLEPLAEDLGIIFLPGVVVDATTRALGIDNPAYAIASHYPSHPITRNFNVLTMYPQTLALESTAGAGWEATALLQTLSRSWTETGPVSGQIRFDRASGERRGPLSIGMALRRTPASGQGAGTEMNHPARREQRVIVVGDGDFLSNRYLGNGGNLDLGLKLVNWLSHDDRFIEINARTAADTALALTRTQMLVIGLGFLFVLPLTLLACGMLLWFTRRRR